MNPIFIIIAIFVVILMVLFGRNPVEEARKEHANKMAGKDALIVAIEEHNKKTSGLGGGGMSFGQQPGIQPQQPMYRPQQPTYQGQPTYPQDQTGAPPNYPAYMMPDGQPRNYQQPQQQAPAPQNSYYPPPSNSAPASPLQTPLAPRSMTEPPGNIWLPTFAKFRSPVTLVSGQEIKFVGSRVYTMDANGIPRPLPDGRYALYNGRVNLVVKDGEKIILN